MFGPPKPLRPVKGRQEVGQRSPLVSTFSAPTGRVWKAPTIRPTESEAGAGMREISRASTLRSDTQSYYEARAGSGTSSSCRGSKKARLTVVNRRLHSEPRSMSEIAIFRQLRRLLAWITSRWPTSWEFRTQKKRDSPQHEETALPHLIQ